MMLSSSETYYFIGNESGDSVDNTEVRRAEFFDVALAIASLGLSVAYMLWYYSPRFGWGYWLSEKNFHRVDVVGQQAREIFVRSMCCIDGGDGTSEANVAIQANRNPITAQSILATGAITVATTLVNIILDDHKMAALRVLSRDDVLTGKSSLISPELKIVAAIISLLLSFFSLVQSLRLFVHAGYFIRASSFLQLHPHVYSEMYGTSHGENQMYKMAMNTNRRAQTFFSLGLRFLYMFIPFIFWLLGGTSLLLSTLILLVSNYFLLDCV